jgi:drug/metabolite transporter (DMT)-like permease
MTSYYGLGLALLAAASWGAVYVVYEQVLKGISPLNSMFLSSISSLAILSTLFFIRGEVPLSGIRAHLGLSIALVVAVVVGTVAQWAILSSIKELGAATASVIEICYPLFTILFLAIFFGQNFSIRFLLGSLLVFLGILLVMTAPKAQ